MHKVLPLLLLSGNVFAHPGHGIPGWVHPHLADLALLGLAGFILGMALWGAKRLLRKSK